ncbi:MAG: stage III sporulation protein AE [Peptococcaceae bacterium]|nr:stage III sporulation protein AE [Peptococcaceae bacterium]
MLIRIIKVVGAGLCWLALWAWLWPETILALPAAEPKEITIQVPEIPGITVFAEDTSLASPSERSSAGQAEDSLTDPLDDLGLRVDLTEMQAYLERLDSDIQAAMPGFSLRRMFDDLRAGRAHLDPAEIGKACLILLQKELLRCAPLMGKLLILAVLGAVLQQLQGVFNGSVSQAARLMTFLVLLGMVIAMFQTAIRLAYTAIDQMTGFMQAIFPVMLSLLLAMGHVTSAALFRPLVLGSLIFLATFLKSVVLPLVFLAAALHLFNQISTQFQVKRLANLLDFAGKTGLGLALTLFIGTMTIQGVVGGVADGVLLRTAKYSADVIPVVGKYFKDAVEIVLGSGILLRNALGVVAVIALLVICAGPAMQIVVMYLVFRVSAALIEPLGEEVLAQSLEQMSKSIFLIFAGVASIAMMFFMTVIIVVGIGNMTVMLR